MNLLEKTKMFAERTGKNRYASKIVPLETIFGNVHRGDRIFIGTACGEPQYLVASLVTYVESNPKAFVDAEVLHVWTLGLAPYANQKFKSNFRQNSFFIGPTTREAVNEGLADYTPIFLSQIPAQFYRKTTPIDVALIQVSPPDINGYMSLGVSVDITKAAVENAQLVVAQVNGFMPRVHGDTFINVAEVDFLVYHDEKLLEYVSTAPDEIVNRIGRYVARIIQDGDTIQVGYGSLPNAILANLMQKKQLGVHTELISDGIAELMKAGVVDNSKKTLHRGKTVATFCMGKEETYDYIHDNPSLQFAPVDYTNNPLVIAQNKNMTAINAALEVDLTGQSTAESIGSLIYSGIGGQADFMRGAVLAPGGKTILTLPSTAQNDSVSRIVPVLKTGTAVTLIRGDIHYVVTEYGIAYLHGKNIRERAMALIAIAHPKYRSWLIEEAKRLNYIYRDQAFIPGKKGEYPEELEMYRTVKTGQEILLRPVKISDEPLLKDFFYDLSDKSMYRRFISRRTDMPHERLQEYVVVDFSKGIVCLAMINEDGNDLVVGLGQYDIMESMQYAEVALVVRDTYQNRGIGEQIVTYLATIAKKQGLAGFTAEVLLENSAMLRVFENMGFEIDRRIEGDVYALKMAFKTA
ncbi:MAG: GNAT family N-acetyltransferase [Deltaproteobacteria bacterium]|nr:GNAT family N-acetyltransferase [Deltaproteobacteria bacterium]